MSVVGSVTAEIVLDTQKFSKPLKTVIEQVESMSKIIKTASSGTSIESMAKKIKSLESSIKQVQDVFKNLNSEVNNTNNNLNRTANNARNVANALTGLRSKTTVYDRSNKYNTLIANEEKLNSLKNRKDYSVYDRANKVREILALEEKISTYKNTRGNGEYNSTYKRLMHLKEILITEEKIKAAQNHRDNGAYDSTYKRVQRYNEVKVAAEEAAKIEEEGVLKAKRANDLMVQSQESRRNKARELTAEVTNYMNALNRKNSVEEIGVRWNNLSATAQLRTAEATQKRVMAINQEIAAEERKNIALQKEINELNQVAVAINENIAKKQQLAERDMAITAQQERQNAVMRKLAQQQRLMASSLTSTSGQYKIVGNSVVDTTGKLNGMSQSLDKNATSAKKAQTSFTNLTQVSYLLGRTLRFMASMYLWSFGMELIEVASTTYKAKSEMESYFDQMGMGVAQVNKFNSALDETVSRFQKVNKYSMGEAVASLGVEFDLTTDQMTKAMDVVAMIQSEYVRAGRTQEEATLAVKDIMQGEFTRLSRETGVGKEELQAAGWSGDTKDIITLMDALEKVGTSRHWDTFAAKATSLSDVITILQNRFGEFAADLATGVTPYIVGAFNVLMAGFTNLSNAFNTLPDWAKLAVDVGILTTAILGLTTAFIGSKTGFGMLEIANYGFASSLSAAIFATDAETVSIVANTVATEENMASIYAETAAQYGSVNTLTAKITSLSAATVQEIGLAGAVQAHILGLTQEQFALGASVTGQTTLSSALAANIATREAGISVMEQEALREQILTIRRVEAAGLLTEEAAAENIRNITKAYGVNVTEMDVMARASLSQIILANTLATEGETAAEVLNTIEKRGLLTTIAASIVAHNSETAAKVFGVNITKVATVETAALTLAEQGLATAIKGTIATILLSNPVGWAAIAVITALVAAIKILGDESTKTSEQIKTFHDTVENGDNMIKESKATVEGYTKRLSELTQGTEEYTRVSELKTKAEENYAMTVEKVRRAKSANAKMEQYQTDAMTNYTNATYQSLKNLTSAYDELGEEQKALLDATMAGMGKEYKAVQAYVGALNQGGEQLKDFSKSLEGNNLTAKRNTELIEEMSQEHLNYAEAVKKASEGDWWGNWDAFWAVMKMGWIEFYVGVENTWARICQAIANNPELQRIANVFHLLGNAVVNIWNMIVSALMSSDIFQRIYQQIKNIIDYLSKQDILTNILNAVGLIGKAIAKVYDTIQQVVAKLTGNEGIGHWAAMLGTGGLLAVIGKVALKFKDLIKGGISKGIGSIIDKFKTLKDSIGKVGDKLKETNIGKKLDDIWTKMKRNKEKSEDSTTTTTKDKTKKTPTKTRTTWKDTKGDITENARKATKIAAKVALAMGILAVGIASLAMPLAALAAVGYVYQSWKPQIMIVGEMLKDIGPQLALLIAGTAGFLAIMQKFGDKLTIDTNTVKSTIKNIVSVMGVASFAIASLVAPISAIALVGATYNALKPQINSAANLLNDFGLTLGVIIGSVAIFLAVFQTFNIKINASAIKQAALGIATVMGLAAEAVILLVAPMLALAGVGWVKDQIGDELLNSGLEVFDVMANVLNTVAPYMLGFIAAVAVASVLVATGGEGLLIVAAGIAAVMLLASEAIILLAAPLAAIAGLGWVKDQLGDTNLDAGLEAIDFIGQAVNKVINTIQGFIENVINAIQTDINLATQTILLAATSLTQIANAFPQLVTAVRQIGTALGFNGDVGNDVGVLANWLVTAVEEGGALWGVKSSVTSILSFASSLATIDVSGAGYIMNVATAMNSIAPGISQIQSAITNIKSSLGVNDAVGATGGFFEGVGQTVSNVLGINTDVADPLSTKLNNLKEQAKKIMTFAATFNTEVAGIDGSGVDGVSQAITNLNDNINAFISNIDAQASNMQAAGERLGNSLADGINSSAGSVTNAGQSLGTAMADGVRSGADPASSHMSGEIDEIVAAINSGEGPVGRAAWNLGKKFADELRSGAGIASPGIAARSMKQEMVYIIDTVNEGVDAVAVAGYNLGNSFASNFTQSFQVDPSVVNSLLQFVNAQSPSMDTTGADVALAQYQADSQMAMGLAATTADTTTATFQNMDLSVGTSFQQMGTTANTQLTSMADKNTQTMTNINTTTTNQLTKMRSTTQNVTTQMTNAWLLMKNNIVTAANNLHTESDAHFNGLSNTIGTFYHKLQNPSMWGGPVKLTRRSTDSSRYSRAKQGMRSSFGRVAGHPSLVGSGPVPTGMMKIKDIISMVCPSGNCFNTTGLDLNATVDVASFLRSIAGDGGFGWNDWVSPNYNRIKSVSDEWSMVGPYIMHTIATGTTFQVKEFENGTPNISFASFQKMAEALFSAIPYDFYYDSAKTGSWVTALQSGSVNCYDGTQAILALARTCGFDGHMEHGSWNGIPHVYAVINGKKMDTTGWQNRRNWNGVSGGPSKASNSSDDNSTHITVNVDLRNSVVQDEESFKQFVSDTVVKEVISLTGRNVATGR